MVWLSTGCTFSPAKYYHHMDRYEEKILREFIPYIQNSILWKEIYGIRQQPGHTL